MKELSTSRRKFLAGTCTFAAAAALAGCSKNDGGGEGYYITASGENEIPGTTMLTDEIVHYGSSPANCGARCVLAAHVRNGVIRRFTTDERPDRNLIDGTGDDPQRRACLKCRGKKGWFYRPDRVLYPLKQTKERGDISGFKRISWEDAAREINQIITDTSNLAGSDDPDVKFSADFNWGKGAFGHGHNTADSGYVCSATRLVDPFLAAYGVAHYFRNGMLSFPQTSMVIHSFLSSNGEPVAMCSSKQDLFNTDFVVLWGLSMMDGAQDGGMWYFTQARDMKKIEFVSVDTFVTRTSQILDARNICPLPGTDSAMLAGMMTHLIDKHFEDCDVKFPSAPRADRYKNDSTYLKLSEIKKYSIGFFDELNPELYRHGRELDGFIIGQSVGQTVTDGTIATTSGVYADGTTFTKGDRLTAGVVYYRSNLQHNYDGDAGAVTPPDSRGEYGVYAVPHGASYSAYLFGSDTMLVEAGLNLATSIYPDTVGYHVRPPKHLSADDLGNHLYDKATPIYGQVKKTPAWASKICGVSEDDIKWLAEQIATRKTYFLSGGGAGGAANRSSEGEQIGLALCTMAVITGCFGESGRSFGVPSAGRQGSAPVMARSYVNPVDPKYAQAAAVNHQSIVAKNIANLGKISYHNIGKSYRMTTTPAMASNFLLERREHNLWQDHGEYGGTGKSKWYDPSVMFTPPYKVMLSSSGNIVNQSGDVLENIRAITERSSNGKYKLEHIITVEPFMTTTAQFSDYVLPAALHFEKQGSGAQSQAASESFMNIPKVIEAPGEAKSELEIYEMITDKAGKKECVNGNLSAFDTMRRYYKALKKDFDLDLSFEEFQACGVATISGTDRPVSYIAYKEYRDNPRLSPLTTVTGKFQIYSQCYIEDFEARRMCNFDTYSGSGVNGKLFTAKDINGNDVPGRIYTKACEFTGELQTAADGKKYVDKPTEFIESNEVAYTTASAAEQEQNERQVRFIYPIPMYIPQVEGRHACDNDQSAPTFVKDNSVTSYTKHPNVLEIDTNKYNFIYNSFHALWRAHSTHNNITYTNETYKVGDDRKSSFLPFERDMYTDADGKQIATVWDIGVYEPVFMNPADASKIDSTLKDGDRVIIESTHDRLYVNPQNTSEKILHKAKIFGAVRFSENQMPGCVKMAEGGWASYINMPDIGPIDVGGNANTLMDKEPGRYGKGSVNSGGCRVKIMKG